MTKDNSNVRRAKELRDAITTVLPLLEDKPDPTAIAKGNRGGKIHDALKLVQNNGLKRDWIQRAWVVWFEHSLGAWEQAIIEYGTRVEEQADEEEQAGEDLWQGFLLRNEVSSPRIGVLRLRNIATHLAMSRTGRDYYRLMDRLLEIMREIRAKDTQSETGQEPLSEQMTRLIVGRSGLLRRNDPHRDLRGFCIMMRSYGLDPKLIKKMYPELWGKLDLTGH